jgi:hypothetical protein
MGVLSDSIVHILSSKIVSELNFLTKPKTEPFSMIRAFPDFAKTIEFFEVLSVNVDNSLYAFVHVPEFKLYYPEPFIASPSFKHEEL